MNSRTRSFCLLLLSSVAVLLITSASALGYTPGWSVTAGSPETGVFGRGVGVDQCDQFDFPDGPMRAFSFINGAGQTRVQMNIPYDTRNYRLVGPTLDTVKPEQLLSGNEQRLCRPQPQPSGYDYNADNVVFKAAKNPDPSVYDDWEWLFSPYLAGDGNVYALLHEEFHGAQFPGTYCPQSTASSGQGALQCWLAAINLAKSTGTEATGNNVNALGAKYTEAAAPNQLVATIPFRYTGDGTHNFGRRGFPGFSNIVYTQRPGDDRPYYYVVMAAAQYPDDTPVQKGGSCLMRTTDLSSASSWRAWGYGGQSTLGFNVQFANPYLTGFDPLTAPAHVCEPVSPSTIPFNRWSLTYNNYLQKYMLVSNSTRNGVYGIYYSLSDDLVNWSEPELIVTAPDPGVTSCTGNTDDDIKYGTLLDPDDPAKDPHFSEPNFDHPGRTPYIYYTRAGVDATCHRTNTGDLSRIHLSFEQRQASLEPSGAVTGNDHAYDSVSSGFFFSTNRPPSGGFPGGYGGSDWYAQAQMLGTYTNGSTSGAVPPKGTINVNWNEGDDVWYSSGFHLSPDFFTNNGDTDILRWEDSTGLYYGGIGMRRSDGKFHLVAGRPGTENNLVTFNPPPTQRWFWLEVHQRFSSDSSRSPVSEVYLDGKLVGSSVAPNRFQESGTISKVNFGFAKVDPFYNSYTYMFVDRSTILGGERGAIGAPATPIGLRVASSNQTSVSLAWNPVSPLVAGDTVSYHVYKRDLTRTGTKWTEVSSGPLTSTSFTDNDYCDSSDYRVTAAETDATDSPGASATTKESNFSAPLSVTTTTPTC